MNGCLYPNKHILENEQESREYIRQVWAEMMDFFWKNRNYKLKLSRKTAEYLKALQKEYMPEDTNVGIIQEWLDKYDGEYVCSLQIYKEAVSKEGGQPSHWDLRDINSIMNNSITGWVKGPQHRFAEYGPQRSWRRIKPKPDFVPVPEGEKVPFD